MIVIIVAALLLIGGTMAAEAEPISTAIGLTALISGLGASAAVAGAIGGAIVTGAISIGLSLVASLFQPSRGDNALAFEGAQAINSAESRFTERQSIPPKRVILGSAFVGGAANLEEFKAPYFYMQMLVNWGEIAGVDGVWAGNNHLSFAAITETAALTPIAVGGQPDYPSRVQVSVRYGASDQAIDPIISAGFSSIGSDFRQRGIATATFRCHIGTTQDEYVSLYGNVPRPNFYLLVRGVAAYDPRDPSQDIDDETTWAWTNNASLLQIFYVTRPWGGRIPMSMVDWDKVAEAADYDDELVGVVGGGFIKRYTVDGVVKLNQRPYDVMLALLSANRGMLLQAGGRVWVTSSKPRTPIATIHDKVLAGGIEYRDAKPKRDLINKLQCRFVASEQDYQQVDGPILIRDDLITADGETLQSTLDLPFTLDHRRAQRLQKTFLETARLGKTITCRVDVTWLADLDDEPVGNAVTFDSDLFDMANGTYLCTSSAFAEDFTAIELALTEYDADIERDWDFATDEQTFEVADLDLS
jgi:hypothetical protein